MNKRRTSRVFIVRAAITLLLLLLTSATAWADKGYNYIANGQERNTYIDDHIPDGNVTVLSGGNTTEFGTNGGSYWYVVTGIDVEYNEWLTFNGNTNLILADGASITIVGDNGIVVKGNLNIYGQSESTGSLTIKTKGNGSTSGDGILAQNGQITINGGILSITADWYGITTTNNDITINGGKITVTSPGENGIDATGNITITGGNVIATGENSTPPGNNGINATGNITITGGYVIANGENYGISAQGTVNLSGGIVTASSYSGTVKVQSGVTYTKYDLTTNYTTDNIDVSSLNGVTIFPTTCFGIASGNNGSQGKPYTITSPEELQLLAIVVNKGNTLIGKYIQVCNNIDMYGIAFRPIGVDSKFCGHFHGGGYIISNLNINIDDTCIGLFGLVDDDNATVQNITISNATINGDIYVGGIVGALDNGSIMNCCVINSKITSSTRVQYYGAIVGKCEESGTLDHNYYDNSTVNEKTSNVGCGNKAGSSDVTTNDGALSATILSDSENVPSSLSGKVVFRRVFTGGKASTICLPFAYTPNGSEGKFYTFDGIKKNGTTYEATMTVVTSTSLNPNMPYLFVPAGNNTIKPVLFHGTAAYDATKLTDTKTPWTFIGTYSPLEYSTNPFSDPVYGFAAKAKGDVIAGEFVMAAEGASIPAMRCFLKYGLQSGTRGETEELPGRITVKLVGDPTSIGTLNTQTGEVTFDGWYSLDGQRFNSKPTKKGLYIYKGIKVTIK